MRHALKPGKPLTRRQVLHAVMVCGSLAAVAFAVGVWMLVATVVGSNATIEDSNRKISALYESATANRAKLVAVGEKPVGPPPEQIVGKAGADGQPGQDGTDGAAGKDGKDGKDGRDATPAQVAAAVAAYLRAHPPKPGPAGPAGAAGEDGADGQSPPCLAEPTACRGADGANGTDGSDGAAGQPPSAWRWTDPATKISYACTRDPDSPDNAPAYGCTVQN